ncbi:unnamed protein product [Peronospora effusa]|uniref:Chromosome transmission fidelity protein 8 n=1 Tax=Peronospora farinosa TaxID=134698 RepID=A0AAV0TQP7_9STRA|nr:unnamed protein product [Peronospora farinosa]CAI5708279.1 unnamed protein product [Peronospora effusa]CAI5724080.1 unnamed protein product [Peronospora farinosa]
MLVPVVVNKALQEWSLLEFQGDLLPMESLDLRGLDIGTLRYGQGETLTLRIGNHVLTGKVMNLSTPFAILHKESEIDVAMDEEGDAESTTKYEVVGIARTRVIFASRPKPVLT